MSRFDIWNRNRAVSSHHDCFEVTECAIFTECETGLKEKGLCVNYIKWQQLDMQTVAEVHPFIVKDSSLKNEHSVIRYLAWSHQLTFRFFFCLCNSKEKCVRKLIIKIDLFPCNEKKWKPLSGHWKCANILHEQAYPKCRYCNWVNINGRLYYQY